LVVPEARKLAQRQAVLGARHRRRWVVPEARE